ncbi:uncharacterized protein LOC123307840 [Coccinella septempunctata]|uniref:uncharacterized protein LOC123307840 n=1 Tax=Coccinella septempunctata TaxID=41139 RepID=UPI001D065555|nr:uncharacterized protein LOC123307840 [Coccinella septempunctata]
MFSTKVVIVFTITLCCVFNYICGQDTAMDDFFMKASKNIPRIGRSNSKSSKGSNDDFENFFLKASKSVPRIGRRYDTEFETMGKKIIPFSSLYYGAHDKSNPGLASLPLSELTKYSDDVNEEDIQDAYDILDAGRMKEIDRAKRTVN